MSRVAKQPAARRLGTYRAKRDLARSGEPGGDEPAAGAAGAPRFVIQKHDATRLHYDFRLEMAGVLKSWAVPKGLATRPGDRTLAIEVEDHPLDYGSFEGVIPPGNYGAGTVLLWDRGHYRVEGSSPEAAWRQGKIHFALLGEKCHGEWTLVRIKSGANDRQPPWLLIKNHDRAGRAPVRIAGRDRSVLSHRTMAQIAAEAPAQSARPSAGRAEPAARKSAPARRRRRSSPAPAFVEPMKAVGVTRVPEGDWLVEVKFDGYRALAVVAGRQAELWSRNRRKIGGDFPEIRAALAQLPCRDAVLDGELVALDSRGRSRFQLLQQRRLARPAPLLFYLFDLLHLDGASQISEPIEQRKARLAHLLRGVGDPLRLSTVFSQAPATVLAEVRRQGLEGIVAKRVGSVYEPGGRSGQWTKCRVAREQEFVIGGYTPPRGSRTHFGALLVGYFERGKLRYAGKVGTGFDEAQLRALAARFVPHVTARCPFDDARKGNGTAGDSLERRSVTWLRPRLVAQIRFSEWTADGRLRQPVLLGLRRDKPAREVVREPVAEPARRRAGHLRAAGAASA